MENMDPTIKLSEFISERNLKRLLTWIDTKAGSSYACQPIVYDFIDHSVRVFRLVRHLTLRSVEIDRRAVVEDAIKSWCANFGLENPAITW